MRIPTVALIATVFSAAQACAEDSPSKVAVELGQADFERHCAACHGLAAKGAGPVSRVLIRRPPDLTRLAERNGGKFPIDAVRRTIDGRSEVEAHGPREMPVWGKRFNWPDNNETSTKKRINNIVAFLKTLQVSGDNSE